MIRLLECGKVAVIKMVSDISTLVEHVGNLPLSCIDHMVKLTNLRDVI